MNVKDKNRLTKQFEDATPEQLGEALAAAKHVLVGKSDDLEAKLVKEYIEGLDLKAEEIKLPAKLKVVAKKFVTVDGVSYSAGQSGEITHKQYHALARFFTKLAALALLSTLFAVPARAQIYQLNAITGVNSAGWNGGTNNIASNAIIGTNIVSTTKLKNFGVQLTYKLTSAGTAGTLVTADTSMDGTNYVAGAGGTMTVTAAGTTLVTGTMMFSNVVPGFFRFSMLNSNTVPMTNVQFLSLNPGVKGL